MIKALIVYASDYQNTFKMAEAVALVEAKIFIGNL